ncbi:MAG: hypothetical protein ABI333_27945 [bacterium]
MSIWTHSQRCELGALVIMGIAVSGCGSGTDAGNGNGNWNHVPQTCIVDGQCSITESCFTCPADCCPDCDPAILTTQQPHDFLVSAMVWPSSASQAAEYGLDLDGDEDADNKGGQIVSLFEGNGAFINDYIAHRIARGEILLVVRIYADDLADDDEVLVQVQPAEMTDATPIFDGNDEVALSTEAPVNRFTCGSIRNGTLETWPAAEVQPLPSPMGVAEGGGLLDFHRMRVAGAVPSGEPSTLIVAGGLTTDTVRQELLPEIAIILNRELAANPNSQFSQATRQLLDGQCVQLEDVEGCEDVVSGQGECIAGEDPPFLSGTEVKCNSLMYSVTTPDIDADGDGDDDLMSFGWQLTVVPVTITD